MTLLAINWAEFGIKAGQFVLSFSIIVVLHEMGHFFPAKWFKCRVEKFYLFFNPWFSLVKKKVGETEYGLGWVPFGGYVKISGMIDESMDKDQLKLPPQPYEFRSKPAWQRLIIMIGGVCVNLVLGFFIYAMMLWHWGEEYVPTSKFTYGISTDSLAKSIGLRDGDYILGVDGEYIEKFNKIPLRVILSGAKNFNIERDGQKMNIAIPEDFAGNLIKYKAVSFIDMRFPFVYVDSVIDKSAAQTAGLKKGDRIIDFNGNPVTSFNEFRRLIGTNKGKTVQLQVAETSIEELKKASAAITIDSSRVRSVSVKVAETGTIGIYPPNLEQFFEVKTIKYTFLQSLPAGFTKSIETLKSYWLQLKLIFSGKVNTNESLGSVISIGKMFPAVWDWQAFWSLTAFFSLVLALMNILPIPALDGGHVLFTLYEIITGRKPGDKFIEYAQMVGMILLLCLMAYALGLDIFRAFKG